MHLAPRFPRDGLQSVSGGVAAENELMVLKDSGTHHMGIRANPRHLLQVDIHAVGKVQFLFLWFVRDSENHSAVKQLLISPDLVIC